MCGSLSEECIERIDALRKEFRTAKPRRKKHNNFMPPAGLILIRQFRGQEYHVLVVEDGFEYNGKVYKSLTSIARIIGTHWKGPEFFGLVSHER